MLFHLRFFFFFLIVILLNYVIHILLFIFKNGSVSHHKKEHSLKLCLIRGRFLAFSLNLFTICFLQLSCKPYFRWRISLGLVSFPLNNSYGSSKKNYPAVLVILFPFLILLSILPLAYLQASLISNCSIEHPTCICIINNSCLCWYMIFDDSNFRFWVIGLGICIQGHYQNFLSFLDKIIYYRITMNPMEVNNVEAYFYQMLHQPNWLASF